MTNFSTGKFFKLIFFFIYLSLSAILCWGRASRPASTPVVKIPAEPDKLNLFRQAYPDINFLSEYNEDLKDWKITLEIPDGNDLRSVVLYWCQGSLLPEEELENKEKYWSLLYYYNSKDDLADPADFTEEQIIAMKKFGSDENRKNGAGTPMFFFDEIYDSKTQIMLEQHIISTKFLGKNIKIHERIKEPLKKVEAKVYKIAESDGEVKAFLEGLFKNEAYYWRLIANTNRKSFHSLGIAIDVQPKYYGGKDVYWSWAKDRDPENWMLTPLSRRWMPPKSVIRAFEEEGFIWGGKWGIWDNMHFEYHPELILNAEAAE